MKNKIGLILLVCLNGAALVLYYAIALVSFGIIVMGTFSIERSNEVVREILTLYAWFGMLSILVNYFILKYLNSITRPVLWAIALSLFCLLVSSSFIYFEREKFLDNGRGHASFNEKGKLVQICANVGVNSQGKAMLSCASEEEYLNLYRNKP